MLLKFFPCQRCCHGNEFWDKIDYNLAFVKDNCALFAPTPLIFGSGQSDDVVKISPLPNPVAMATNLGTEIDYNSALVKILYLPFLPYLRDGQALTPAQR